MENRYLVLSLAASMILLAAVYVAFSMASTNTLNSFARICLFSNCHKTTTTTIKTTTTSTTTTIPSNTPKRYYLTMVVIPTGSGTLSPGSGFYNANSIVNIGATGNGNYIFYAWDGVGLGSYTGNVPAAKITMLGNITETAYFH